MFGVYSFLCARFKMQLRQNFEIEKKEKHIPKRQKIIGFSLWIWLRYIDGSWAVYRVNISLIIPNN